MELQLSNMQKSFDEKKVLENITFTFEKGKIYGLLGRNGAGKTTLFNCLAGEMESDQGDANLLIGQEGQGEKKIKNLSPDDLGYVFSTPILPDFLTGYEFIKFYIDINKGRICEQKSIESYFDFIQLELEDRHRLIKGYSHGMKNKLQMLCFLISRPPVILLDEPLTSFDVVVALEMKKLLKEIKKDHIIIFSTHILELAMDLCDEIVVLSKGKLTGLDAEILQQENLEQTIIELLRDGELGEEIAGQNEKINISDANNISN